jgi:hypothetical protein
MNPPAVAAATTRTPSKKDKKKKLQSATPAAASCAQQSPPTPPPPRTISEEEANLCNNVRLEFSNTIYSIRDTPENAYASASRLVYTFRRYVTSKKLAGMLIRAMSRARSKAFKDHAMFEQEITSLLTFADVWLRTLIDTEFIENSKTFISIVGELCRANNEVVRLHASRVMCSILWALTRHCSLRSVSPTDAGRNGGNGSVSSTPRQPSEVEYTRLVPSDSGRLWDHKHETLAELFGVIEWKHLAAVPFVDFQNKAWSNAEEHANRAQALRNYIERSNRISEWVASSILSQRSAKGKGKALEAFILLSKHCLDSGNFNVSSSILTGIEMREVSRIRALMPVPDKYIKIFDYINHLLAHAHNYGNYRKALADRIKSGKPFIPIMCVILRDLTFIEDANPDTVERARINTSKMTQLQESYEVLHRAMVSPYKSTKFNGEYAYVIQVFERLPRLSPSDLTMLSGQVKPIAAHSDTGDDSSSARGSPTASRTASMSLAPASVVVPADYYAGSEDSSSSSRNEIVDLPLDVSSMSDKSFLGLAGSSSRNSTQGPDVNQDV